MTVGEMGYHAYNLKRATHVTVTNRSSVAVGPDVWANKVTRYRLGKVVFGTMIVIDVEFDAAAGVTRMLELRNATMGPARAKEPGLT